MEETQKENYSKRIKQDKGKHLKGSQTFFCVQKKEDKKHSDFLTRNEKAHNKRLKHPRGKTVTLDTVDSVTGSFKNNGGTKISSPNIFKAKKALPQSNFLRVLKTPPKVCSHHRESTC